MSKTGLRKELLRIEKEKNWRLLSQGDHLELGTLEDIFFQKWGYEVFRRNDVHIWSSSLSPDAKKITFFIGPELYTINADGSNLELITDAFGQIGSFGDGICWSPDTKKVAFVGVPKGKYNREELNSLRIKFGHILPQSLYLIDLETGKVETLVEDNVWIIYSQAWSNDSKEILYITTDREIMIYNLESKSSRRLAKGGYPSWSRDGKWIVFSEGLSTEGRYYIIHPDGSDKTLLLAHKRKKGEVPLVKYRKLFSGQLLWSPDNTYLLLHSIGVKMVKLIIPSHEYYTVYVMDFETKQIIRLGEGLFTSWEGNP